MRVLSPAGDQQDIRARAGWPQAGVNTPTEWSSGWSAISLAPLATGEVRAATYYQIYRTNPWVFGAVGLISRGIARLPIRLFQMLPDGGRIRVRGDVPGIVGRPSAAQQIDYLFHTPAPRISRRRLIAKTVADLMIYGNGLWTIDRLPGAAAPSAIWHAPWRKIVVHEGDQIPVLSYELRGQTGSNHFDPDSCVAFGAENNPDGPVGISPLEPLQFTLKLNDAIQRQVSAYFANAARPSGFLKVPPGTSERDVARVRETVRQLYANPEAAGKVLVSSAEWQGMGQPPSQSDVVELVEKSREEILTVYNIPPPIAGILDNAIKSNVVDLRQMLNRDVLGSWAEMIESEIEAQLLEPLPAVNYCFTEFDFSEVLKPDLPTRAAAYKQLDEVASLDELRAMENLPPIGTDDAKVPKWPVNMRPVGLTVGAYGAAAQPGTEPDEPPEQPALPGEQPDDTEDEDELG